MFLICSPPSCFIRYQKMSHHRDGFIMILSAMAQNSLSVEEYSLVYNDRDPQLNGTLVAKLESNSFSDKLNSQGGSMQTKLKLTIAGLVLGVGLSACGRDRADRVADTTTTPPPPSATAPTVPPPGGTGTVMSNSELENAVKAKFQSDDQLRAANLSVNADVDKKEVTISGTLPSQDLRNRAVDLAKNAQPGVTVNDKIDVKPAA